MLELLSCSISLGDGNIEMVPQKCCLGCGVLELLGNCRLGVRFRVESFLVRLGNRGGSLLVRLGNRGGSLLVRLGNRGLGVRFRLAELPASELAR